MALKDLGIKVKISQRPLEVIYVIDTSGSMSGRKIESVNNAMYELESLLKAEAKKNPSAQVNIRIITFGDTTAKWHLKEKTPIEKFKYESINNTCGMTPMGAAFYLLNHALDENHIEDRSLRPIVVLLSDGLPNDNYEGNLTRLLSLPWGKKAVKVAIAIGNDADKNLLARFTCNPNLVLNANNSTNLKNFIKWTSTLVTHSTKNVNDESGLVNQVRNIKKVDTVNNDDSDF